MSEQEPNGWSEHWRPRLAWAAIAAFVILYDITSPKGETLSEEMYRIRSTKLGRFVADKVMDDVVNHLRGEHNWINELGRLSPKDSSPKPDGSDRFDVFDTDD